MFIRAQSILLRKTQIPLQKWRRGILRIVGPKRVCGEGNMRHCVGREWCAAKRFTNSSRLPAPEYKEEEPSQREEISMQYSPFQARGE
jgi:hypothetical protein